MKNKVSIIIPVYNNHGSLIPSYDTIKLELENQFKDWDYEFVFVNDGSKDGSLGELLQLREMDATHVKVINFSRNFGQFSALNAGLHYAKGDYMVSISADQQDPPETVTMMLEKAVNIKGVEIVLAIREARNDNFLKNLTAGFHVWLIRKTAQNYPIGGFDTWLLSRKAVEAYKKYEDVIRTNQMDILNLGFKTEKIFFKRRKREIGKSQYNFKKRMKLSLNQILANSSWPLKLVSVLGFITTIIGFIYGLRVIILYFTKGTPFAGYAPIILLQLLIGGIIMLMLGVIGEYQWRIFYETKKRPLFIIDEIYE